MTSPAPGRSDFDRIRDSGDPLPEQLRRYAASHGERSPVVAAAYQALVETLECADAGAGAPKAGDRLPPFVLPDHDGRLRFLDELLSEGPLVISFNRGGWCSYCGFELSALERVLGAIREAGGTLVSITPETATYSRRLRERLGLSFPVLSDLDNGYALELGLAVATSPEVRRLLEERGTDLCLYQRNEAWFVPIPATLVVDRGGVVREAYVNPDFRQRLDPASLPAAIAALR